MEGVSEQPQISAHPLPSRNRKKLRNDQTRPKHPWSEVELWSTVSQTVRGNTPKVLEREGATATEHKGSSPAESRNHQDTYDFEVFALQAGLIFSVENPC